MRICLDPGHGGKDSGAISSWFDRPTEAKLNLQFAEEIHASLMLARQDTVWTRRCVHETVSLAERVVIANDGKCDLFLSVHCNAADRPAPFGFEVWHFPKSNEGTLFAAFVEGEARKVTHSRGKKARAFYVLKHTRMPAVLVECGFLTSREDTARLMSASFRRALGRAIASGVLLYIAEVRGDE